MKILLLSDTHGHLDDTILKYCSKVDEIWHAGDFGSVAVSDSLSGIKKLRAVYGNIDGHELRKIHPEIQTFTVEGLKVLMIHIGGDHGRYPDLVANEIRTFKPHLFICGHSHILKVTRNKMHDNMLCINPGAAGKYGFHTVRTMLRMEVCNGTISNLEVIELGKR